MTTESAMYPVLREYLERRGYCAASEIRPARGSPREYDVVGVRLRERLAVTIEAKNGHFRAALAQAELRRLVSDRVFVSFPWDYARFVRGRHAGALRDSGIGLLAVRGSRVRQLMPAMVSPNVDQTRREALIERVLAWKESRG